MGARFFSQISSVLRSAACKHEGQFTASGPGLVLHRLRFAVRAWIAPVARRRVCRLETCDEALRDKFRGILELPPLLLLVLLAIWRVPGAPDVAFAADMANTPGYDQQDWHKINKEQGLQADKLSDRPGQTGVLVETFEPISRYDMSSLLPGDLSLVARQCSAIRFEEPWCSTRKCERAPQFLRTQNTTLPDPRCQSAISSGWRGQAVARAVQGRQTLVP